MRKRIIAFLMCLTQLFSLLIIPVEAEEETSDFWSQVTTMIETYQEDDYFSVMTVTIGQSEINIDGEVKPIDESNSVPYVENGRTMMPVRGIAEAMGGRCILRWSRTNGKGRDSRNNGLNDNWFR